MQLIINGGKNNFRRKIIQKNKSLLKTTQEKIFRSFRDQSTPFSVERSILFHGNVLPVATNISP